MEKKQNCTEIQDILKQRKINRLYHFTDFENLESIIKNGGLYSWADCADKGIRIPRQGGSQVSMDLDARDNLQHFVRLSFTAKHPMMYVAMNDGRISNPVILEIDPEVVCWRDTKFADRNAVKNGANVGGGLADFKKIHFDTALTDNYFDLSQEEQPFYQAEVLVKNHIPLSMIKNIGNFGISIPSQPQKLQIKNPYTAQITRNTPTAFIFLVDQSVSMSRKTSLFGEEMTMAEAVSLIINRQINELVLRCIKTNEVRHYYDIAVIGYGETAYSIWGGGLSGRDFVSPEELKDNPFKKIIVQEPKRTRSGVVMREVEKVQWIEPRSDGKWTHLHEAFDYARRLLDQWMERHHEQDCYPPTIINITDGQFNHATKESVLQKANELKSMFTNDGNVILFNIHISTDQGMSLSFPTEKSELNGNTYAETLFEMSSLLPLRYNPEIAKMRAGSPEKRHSAMGVNTDGATLIKIMDIGTPTNISQNQ